MKYIVEQVDLGVLTLLKVIVVTLFLFIEWHKLIKIKNYPEKLEFFL